MIDTKPNLSDNKFEQCIGDILALSGCTCIHGQFVIACGATSQILPGAGLGKYFTSDEFGYGTWQDFAGITGATNGLTKSGQNIILGGALNADTTIDINCKTFSVCGDVGVNFIKIVEPTGFDSCLILNSCTCTSICGNCCIGIHANTNLGIGFNGTAVITDSTPIPSGLTYASTTYRNTFGDTSLVDKGYVLSLISGVTGSSLTAAGDRITKLINQASHGFNVNDVIGWSGGTYNKPIANGLYDGEVLGIVSKCYNADCFDLTQAGYVTGLTSLSTNSTYFLSPTTAGLLTTVEPTGNTQISKAVLIANSSTSAWVLPYPGYIITTGTTGGGISLADNGLTTDGTTVCLGGTLLNDTSIVTNGNDLNFCNAVGSTGISILNEDAVCIKACSGNIETYISLDPALVSLTYGISDSVLGDDYNVYACPSCFCHVVNVNYGANRSSIELSGGSIITCQTGNLYMRGLPARISETNVLYIDAIGKISTGVTTGGGTVTGATNGLTLSGKNIILGGTLTGNTTINPNGKYFEVDDGSLINFSVNSSVGNPRINAELYSGVFDSWINICPQRIDIYSQSGSTHWSNLSLRDGCTRLVFKGGDAFIGDCNTSPRGLQYCANYGPTFTARSLVDAAYVTGKTSAVKFGWSNLTNGSTVAGCGTQASGSTLCNSTYYGVYAGGLTTTGKTNTAIGAYSLYNTTCGTGNTAMGLHANFSNTRGCNNVIIGHQAACAGGCGCSNVAIGYQAFKCNGYGVCNIAIGHQANMGIGPSSGGNHNIALGYQTLMCNTSGSQNIAMGCQALLCNINGDQNIALGPSSLGLNTSGMNNVGLGYYTLGSNSTGCNGIAIGWGALGNNTTGCNSIALGYRALLGGGRDNISMGYESMRYNISGSGNTAMGCNALICNTTGCHNIAIGLFALSANTSSCGNIALGFEALRRNTGGYNIAIGCQALCKTTGSHNIALGLQALGNNTSGQQGVAIGQCALANNTTANENTAVGAFALYTNSGGGDNSAFGKSALLANSTGRNNTAVGAYSLGANSTGTGNTAIGMYAGYLASASACNKLYIANNQNSTLIGGDFLTRCVDINGQLKITGVTSGACTDSVLVWNSTDRLVKKVPYYSGGTFAIVSGSTCVSSPIVCGTTCVASPIMVASNCSLSPKFIENGTCLASTYLPFTMTTDWQDPTGFVDGSNINVGYNYANRTITLSGNLDYYWKGVKKTLTSPWTSAAHTNSVGTWFLYSTDGTNFAWSSSVWNFSDVMVALVNYKSTSGTTFAIRETHGMMPWSTHQDLHKNIGTYLYSGGAATSWTANTATNNANSPNFNTAVIADEDNQTTISGITKGAYTLMRVSGGTSIYTLASTTPFSGATNEFIRVNDPITGGWTAGINARYYNVYQFLIPSTSDVTSQKFRTIFLQPQATYTTLATAQAEDSRGLYLGSLASESNEFIPYARITYFTANANNNYGKVTIPTNGISYIIGNRMGSTSMSGVVSPNNHSALSNLTWASSGHVGTNDSVAAFDGTGSATNILTSTLAKYCQFTISGNSSATGFTVNHALSNQFVSVQVAQAASPYATIYTTVQRPNANCVCVTFDVAPTTGTNYKVLITG